jgi:excinuclease UvrABC ATPase subunit
MQITAYVLDRFVEAGNSVVVIEHISVERRSCR